MLTLLLGLHSSFTSTSQFCFLPFPSLAQMLVGTQLHAQLSLNLLPEENCDNTSPFILLTSWSLGYDVL